MLDNSIGCAVRTRLLGTTGLSNMSEKVNDLNPSNVRRCRRLIRDFRKSLILRMNPFDETFDKAYLYNISTGRAGPLEVADYLLSV